jgi:hypothetical protein
LVIILLLGLRAAKRCRVPKEAWDKAQAQVTPTLCTAAKSSEMTKEAQAVWTARGRAFGPLRALMGRYMVQLRLKPASRSLVVVPPGPAGFDAVTSVTRIFISPRDSDL